jgi:hypothetical protein
MILKKSARLAVAEETQLSLDKFLGADFVDAWTIHRWKIKFHSLNDSGKE